MSLGFTLAGFKSILAIDHDPYSIETYRANFGDHAILGDIRHIDTFPPADLVIGGPPCQGFSRLGKQARRDREENLLWREYMRCVEVSAPKMFVIENVPDFFKDPAWTGVQHEAHRLEYELAAGILNAADYGVPQRRHRAFVIGS